jgi:hypothetical protein
MPAKINHIWNIDRTMKSEGQRWINIRASLFTGTGNGTVNVGNGCQEKMSRVGIERIGKVEKEIESFVPRKAVGTGIFRKVEKKLENSSEQKGIDCELDVFVLCMTTSTGCLPRYWFQRIDHPTSAWPTCL